MFGGKIMCRRLTFFSLSLSTAKLASSIELFSLSILLRSPSLKTKQTRTRYCNCITVLKTRRIKRRVFDSDKVECAVFEDESEKKNFKNVFVGFQSQIRHWFFDAKWIKSKNLILQFDRIKVVTLQNDV